MKFCQIAFGTEDYKNALVIRDAILRKPIGRQLTAADVDGEEDQLHFCLRDDDQKMIACVVAKPISNDEIKVRHVAILDEYQGTGLGLQLMSELENAVAQLGYHKLQLDSRKHVSKFYLKAGYTPVGEEFELIGMPHIKMIKVPA